MALTDESGNGMVMPVAPMYGGGNNGGWGNGFGGDGWWIILLLLFAGGWGNGFGGYGGGMNAAAADGAMLYPWLNQAELTNAGFQNAAVSGQLNGIQAGVQGLSTQLCNCCADMAQTVTSGFANAETAANARQIANMQQAFASQMATQQGFNALASSFADCCCENRLGIANLNSTILAENCADRAAVSDGIRDIIVNQTANTQRILDQMCNDKIDAKNERIADLERQLTMANLQASQTAQTSRILADNARQTTALEQYLNPVPVPAYVVANPNCCSQNSCGCGCGV